MFKKLCIFLLAFMFCSSIFAEEKIRVVTTIPDFKNFVEIIGGDKVSVASFIKGYQDAHHFEIKPSDIMRLKGADLLIINGADLDYWIYPLIEKSRNQNIRKGSKGFIDASQGIKLMEIPTEKVDRSMGDVHPYGNPHYNLSPTAMKIAFQHIADALSALYPEYKAYFQQNAKRYELKLDEKMVAWENALKNSQSLGIIVYHNSWSYFFNEFNLTPTEFIEPKPGISPSPAYLNKLIQTVNTQNKSGIILKETYQNADIAAFVAQKTRYKVDEVATFVGGTKEASDYIAMIDAIVNRIANAKKREADND